MRSIRIAAAALVLAACSSTTEVDLRWADPATIDYAPQLGVDLLQMERRPSGLYVQDLEVGPGTVAVAGNTVVVHYTGWLPDGTVFDSSYEREKPLSFMLGVGLVIRGWDEGLVGMRVGGRRRLVVPPSLGYGRPGSPPAIPPLATLVFDVHMINVQP
jgi:FKBP-type peptidyl-prolyl cis-trans isomerase FkpA